MGTSQKIKNQVPYMDTLLVKLKVELRKKDLIIKNLLYPLCYYNGRGVCKMISLYENSIS